MKDLNKDLFILILGHARSGTSLCANLLSKDSRVKIGMEINNQELSKGAINAVFPDMYNGNKVCIFEKISHADVIESIRRKSCIIGDEWNDLKIIFTKRNVVSSMVSKKFREMNKGNNFDYDEIVELYSFHEKELRKLKELLPEHFVFNFDEAILDQNIVRNMFRFVGIKYNSRYYTKYRGIKPYLYLGVGPKFIYFGREDKYLEERKNFELEIGKQCPWLLEDCRN